MEQNTDAIKQQYCTEYDNIQRKKSIYWKTMMQILYQHIYAHKQDDEN